MSSKIQLALTVVSAIALKSAQFLESHPVLSAMMVVSIYVVAGVMLAMGSAWATPIFVFGVVMTLVGFWLEAHGWELILAAFSGRDR